jgi:hypothetical protein
VDGQRNDRLGRKRQQPPVQYRRKVLRRYTESEAHADAYSDAHSYGHGYANANTDTYTYT